MRQGCRGTGLGRSAAIAALVLGVALLALAVAPSRPLAGSHRAASLRAPATASSQSSGSGPSPSLSAPFARSLPSSRSNPYRAGDVILAFRPGVSTARQHAIERAAGGSAATRLGPAIKPVGHGRVGTQEFISPMKLRVPATRELAVTEVMRLGDQQEPKQEPDEALARALDQGPSCQAPTASHAWTPGPLHTFS